MASYLVECKSCGAENQCEEGQQTFVCTHCDSKNTVAKSLNTLSELFNRANFLRRSNEFDKAISAYEDILKQDNTDYEAHWGLVLCKYGIEYVEDPETHKLVPTCNRTQYDAIINDAEYLAALEYAPYEVRSAYEEEARYIDKVQREILALAQKQEAFDVFLCYKETDETGNRSKDSVLAQELEFELSKRGYRVFFARKTLEGKLGSAYEPLIFSAIHSAKVMVVLGTKPENFISPWVKNEWSRYRALIMQGEEKTIIPAYRGMSPYQLPAEFAQLQALDMSKLGFVQDLSDGIDKLAKGAGKRNEGASFARVAPGVENLMRRVKLFLEDGDYRNAEEYIEKVLDINAEYAPAYIAKLMAELKLKDEKDLAHHTVSLSKYSDFQKALRFADIKEKQIYESYDKAIVTRLEEEQRQLQQRKEYERNNSRYSDAMKDKANAITMLKNLPNNKNEYDLNTASIQLDKYISQALNSFKVIVSFKDSTQQILECNKLRDEYEIIRKITEGKIRKRRKIRNRIILVLFTLCALVLAIYLLVTQVIIPRGYYIQAEKLFAQGEYDAAALEYAKAGYYADAGEMVHRSYYLHGEVYLAIEQFEYAADEFTKAGNYSDASERLLETYYQHGEVLLAKGKYDEAVGEFIKAGNYSNASEKVQESYYQKGMTFFKSKQYQDAIYEFQKAGEYSNASNMILEAYYYKAETLLETGQFEDALLSTNEISDSITETRILEACYQYADELLENKKYREALLAFQRISPYRDALSKAYLIGRQYLYWGRISAGTYHSVGVNSDGKVVAGGENNDGQCDVSGWRNVISVSAGKNYSIGLQENGSVIATGDNSYGQCNISSWRDIVAVSTGAFHTVGLRSNGTVVAIGNNKYGQCDVSGWQNIVAIASGKNYTVGLCSDGTVLAVGYNDSRQLDALLEWNDIVAIAAGESNIVGMCADGSFVKTGYFVRFIGDMSKWQNIKMISAGYGYAIGLKQNGTVEYFGEDDDGISKWENIVAVSASTGYTLGLCSNGKLEIAVHRYMGLKNSIATWTLDMD